MTGKMGKDEKPKDEKPVELDEGSKIILQELEKHLDKCVGDQCDQMRKELRTEIQSGKLDEAAIKKITDDLQKRLGTEVKSEYTEPIKAMNVRMTQYGSKVEKTAERVDAAVESVKTLTTDIKGVNDTVKASMGRLEELDKARIEAEKTKLAAETAKLQAEKGLADASKAALEKAQAEKAATPAPAPPAHPEPCPNCQYDPTKGTPKVTAGCPTCRTSFTKHETDPPAQDAQGNAIGGQGYKFCPGCGSPLAPITELRTKKAPAAPKPIAAPAAPQAAAAAQPKAQ